MPLVRVRILLGKTQLAAPSRPFAEHATLQDVVGKALADLADFGLTLRSFAAPPTPFSLTPRAAASSS